MANALIESWQCDEDEHYDNVSDEYLYRGALRTGKDGKYSFKTIVPVPYKDGEGWRPSHIHFRISSNDHQDLITQIYFEGDMRRCTYRKRCGSEFTAIGKPNFGHHKKFRQ